MTQSNSLMKKLALAAVGQALPETSALTASLKATQRGLLLTVVTGVFVAALLLLALFGFYLFLRSEGVSSLTAICLLSGLLFLLTIITGLMAERHLNKATEVKKELDPFQGMGQLAAPVEEIVSAFVSGFMTAPSKRYSGTQQAMRDDDTPDNSDDLAHAHNKQCEAYHSDLAAAGGVRNGNGNGRATL